MMVSLDLPKPIVFGPKFPKLGLRLEAGHQYLYSLSNYNLYIEETNLTKDGTFTVGSLLSYHRGWFGEGMPGFVYDENLMLPECKAYERACPEQPCPMLIESCEQREYTDDQSDKPVLKLTRVKLHARPRLNDCRLLSALLACVTTPAEKRFAETYYTWAIDGARRWPYRNLNKEYGHLVGKWWKESDLQPTGGPESISVNILLSLEAPALIPQVWLNYSYDPSRSPQQEKERLRGMPRRVDFLFIREGQKHVVEVDDPSHYAKYDERKRKYEVDEEQYTSNLRAERAFRQQRFQIHRMSNWEITNATESELIELIPDVLGIPQRL